jgi:hypothetical protein
MSDTSIVTCIIESCKKPLGQESRDLDYRVCHEHRICPICNEILPPHEVQRCHSEMLEALETDTSASLDLRHARCKVLSLGNVDQTLAVKESYLNFLNQIRLCLVPDLALSEQTNTNNAMIASTRLVHDMDNDMRYMHLKMLEACVANVNLALSQDKKKLKEAADLREARKFAKAQKDALLNQANTAPAKRDDAGELALATFMKDNDIAERKNAMKIIKDYNKGVAGLCAIGVSDELARKQFTEMLISQGRVKKGPIPRYE